MAESPRAAVPLGVQAAIYGAALFNFSMVMMASVVIPLWAVELKASAFLIGVIVGARHFLTLALSIHGGVLMDRLGTRRVMLAFALVAVTAPLLFPLTPWIPGLIMLQMVAGLADAMGWMGAQTLSGQIMKGNPVYVGRMTFAVRFGSFVGPLAVGLAWDNLGVWGAFVTMSLWSSLGFLSVLRISVPPAPAAQAPGYRVRPRDLVPRLGDYVAAFRLAAAPAVAMVLFAAMLRVGGTGIQSSFYVVYLDGIGINGAEIGLLIGVAGLCASLGSLVVGPIARRIHPHWVVVLAVAMTIVTIAVTPLLLGVYAILMLVIGLRGLCLGISHPMEISVLSRALAADSQGKGVGLRTTVNRIAHTLVPMIMGAVAQFAGIGNSFLIMGVLLLAALALVARFVHRRPELGGTGGAGG